MLTPWSDGEEVDPNGITITNTTTVSSLTKTIPPTKSDVDEAYRALFPVDETHLEGVPTNHEMDLLTTNLSDMAKVMKNTNYWNKSPDHPLTCGGHLHYDSRSHLAYTLMNTYPDLNIGFAKTYMRTYFAQKPSYGPRAKNF